MAQFVLDPNDFNVGDGLAELPLELIPGRDEALDLEIVSFEDGNALRIRASGGDEIADYRLTNVTDSDGRVEMYIDVSNQNPGAGRVRCWPRWSGSATNRNGNRARFQMDNNSNHQAAPFIADNAPTNSAANVSEHNNSFQLIGFVDNNQFGSTFEQDGTIVDVRGGTGDFSELPAGGAAIGARDGSDMYFRFIGVGTDGDEAPQSSGDADNGDDVDPAEPGTRVNFPSLPVTATIVTEGGIDSEDQLVEVSTASGWGSPPFLVAMGDEEPFDVALVLDVDGTTVTLKRDFVNATTPAAHANGVAIRPALIGDQLERIYAEFEAISSVLFGYDPPTYPETNDPNQSWTT